MAEWLRREIRNLLCSARMGSNPIPVVSLPFQGDIFVLFTFSNDIFDLCLKLKGHNTFPFKHFVSVSCSLFLDYTTFFFSISKKIIYSSIVRLD